MYNKTSFINETDYAEVSGTRWIMRDLPNYAEGYQLCAKLCARIILHIIQRSLVLHMAQLMPLPLTVSCFSKIQIGFTQGWLNYARKICKLCATILEIMRALFANYAQIMRTFCESCANYAQRF